MNTTLSFAGQNNKWNTAEDAADVVKAIKETETLKCLVLEANTLGIEAARVIGDALAEHPEFERAHWKDLFTGRLKDEIPQALKHLFSGLIRAGANLKELDLSDNALGPVGVTGMIDFMSSAVCYSLEELRLNNNGLGITGGTNLCNSLKKLVTNAKEAGTPLKLKVFISGRNRLEKEGAKVFSEFFSSVGTLEEVAMPQNGIFHEGIAALARAFSKNPSLRVINLNDNTFTPKGAKAMAAHLPDMRNLEIINFGDCLLKTAGALCISEAICDSHFKLKELHLDSNEIGIEGGMAIVKAIGNKENLQVLMLDANCFGDEGATLITEYMEEIGKADALLEMEDNEEPDSDEEKNDDEESSEESDSGSDEEEDLEESFSNVPDSLQAVKCTPEEFYQQPTAAKLLGLGNSACEELLEEINKQHYGEDIQSIIISTVNLFMKICSLSSSTDKKVKDHVNKLCSELAKSAFTMADENKCTSVVTNSVLVHLGLIKCEDKGFKIEWDLRNCFMMLARIIPETYFPKETKDTLQLFLQRSNVLSEYTEERRRIMESIFK